MIVPVIQMEGARAVPCFLREGRVRQLTRNICD